MSHELRWCFKCKQFLGLNDFYKNKAKKDGLSSSCKKCNTQLYREYKLKNRAVVREKRKAYSKIYYKKNRDKYALWGKRRKRIRSHDCARAALKWAVDSGKVFKPNQCSDCKVILPKDKIHGHHEDYSKPLEVKWVCHPCHGKIHRKYQEAA